jgi:hypothetical protein
MASWRPASAANLALFRWCSVDQSPPLSCRNRHCRKCQGAAAKSWLADREADLLPVPYYQVVLTRPAAIADVA